MDIKMIAKLTRIANALQGEADKKLDLLPTAAEKVYPTADISLESAHAPSKIGISVFVKGFGRTPAKIYHITKQMLKEETSECIIESLLAEDAI